MRPRRAHCIPLLVPRLPHVSDPLLGRVVCESSSRVRSRLPGSGRKELACCLGESCDSRLSSLSFRLLPLERLARWFAQCLESRRWAYQRAGPATRSWAASSAAKSAKVGAGRTPQQAPPPHHYVSSAGEDRTPWIFCM